METAALGNAGVTPMAIVQPDEPGPPPIPTPLPVSSLFPTQVVPEIAPPQSDPDALKLMVEVQGDAVERELLGGLQWIDAKLLQTCQSILRTADPRAELAEISRLAADRSTYCARLQAVRGLLGVTAEPPPEVVLPSLMQFLRHAPSDVGVRIAEALDTARTNLADVEHQIADTRHVLKDPERYRQAGAPSGDRLDAAKKVALRAIAEVCELGKRTTGDGLKLWNEAVRVLGGSELPTLNYPDRASQDAVLATLSKHYARRRELTARLAVLEQDKHAATMAVSTAVKAAVQRAGGEAKVIEAVMAAETLGNSLPATLSPFVADVQSAVDDHKRVVSDIESLENSGLGGDATEHLKGLRTETAANLARARNALASEHRRLAANLLAEASSGVEHSRARLEALAASVPFAFGSGFPVAISASRFDRVVLAELATVLTSTTENE